MSRVLNVLYCCFVPFTQRARRLASLARRMTSWARWMMCLARWGLFLPHHEQRNGFLRPSSNSPSWCSDVVGRLPMIGSIAPRDSVPLWASCTSRFYVAPICMAGRLRDLRRAFLSSGLFAIHRPFT